MKQHEEKEKLIIVNVGKGHIWMRKEEYDTFKKLNNEYRKRMYYLKK